MGVNIFFFEIIVVCRVDPTGEFSKQWFGSWAINLGSAENSLKKEMRFVQNEAKNKLEKLSTAEDSQIGLEMLHLFVLDLLGRDTPAAKIFLVKSLVESILFSFFFSFLLVSDMRMSFLDLQKLLDGSLWY